MMQSNVIEKNRCWGKNYKWTLYYDKQPVEGATRLTYLEAREKEDELRRTGKYNFTKFAILPCTKAKR